MGVGRVMRTSRTLTSGLVLVLALVVPLTPSMAGADPVPQTLPQASLPAYGSQQSVLVRAGSCASSDPTTVACAIPSPRQLRVLCLGYASLETVTVFARFHPTEVVATQAVSCSDPAGYAKDLIPGESALVTVTQSLSHSCTTSNPSIMVCAVASPRTVAVYCVSATEHPFQSVASANVPYVRFAGALASIDVACDYPGLPADEQLADTTERYRLYDGTPYKVHACTWAGEEGSCRPLGHGIQVTCGSVEDPFAIAYVTAGGPPALRGVVTALNIGCVVPMSSSPSS